MNTSSENLKFSPRQRLVCALCFGAYLFAYLIRVNLSIALPDITEFLGYSDTSAVGNIPGAFFWTYAVGQLISGWLGDRISPKYMIATGLSASIIINVLFAFSNSLTAMIVLWALNGIFQSMLWAPVMKTIVLNFEGERLRKMTFAMSFTLVFGYSISWSASTIIKTFLGWRFVFILPAVVTAIFVACWLLLYKREGERTLVAENDTPTKITSLFHIKFFTVTLILIIFVSILHGIIKESINTWLPTMMESLGSFSLSSTLGILLIVPIVNFIGIMLMKFIMSKGKANYYFTVFVLLLISFIVAVAASVFCDIHVAVLVGLTIAMSGLMFAVNPVFTAFIPLDFERWNCVSTLAGLIDCAIYVGAAFSSPLTSILADGSDWSLVTVMWAIVLLIATVASALLKHFSAKVFK